MKLYEIAKLVRAKNAGPFMLTIDIIFEDKMKYDLAVSSNVINSQLISKLYEVPLKQVEYYEVPNAYAIKFSFPRKSSAGDVTDDDLFGGQQHAPLVFLEIPAKGN